MRSRDLQRHGHRLAAVRWTQFAVSVSAVSIASHATSRRQAVAAPATRKPSSANQPLLGLGRFSLRALHGCAAQVSAAGGASAFARRRAPLDRRWHRQRARSVSAMPRSYVREARSASGRRSSAIRPIIERLAAEHADATIALRFRNRLELLVSVMLSAQTTDVNVNRVTDDAVREVPPARGLPRRAGGGARARHLRDRLLPAEGEGAPRDDADAARGVRRRGAADVRRARAPARRRAQDGERRLGRARRARRASSSTRTCGGSRSGSG